MAKKHNIYSPPPPPIHAEHISTETGELIVFIIREWANSKEKIDIILNILKREKIDVIKTLYIAENQKYVVADNIRGGEWGKGPFPVNGGLPSYCIIAFDYNPVILKKTSKKHPFVFNQNVFVKNIVRNYFNYRTLRNKWTNCIHSSDDEIEAWEYIKYICPDDFNEIKDNVSILKEKYKTNYNVIKSMPSHKTRAKVELIEYEKDGNTIQAIKKTYKHGYTRFLEREKYVYSILGQKYNFIPALLKATDSYIIIPYFENKLIGKTKKKRNKIISKFSHEIINVIYSFYKEGYALIDFTFNNILITSKNEIKIIDFEFLYQYENKPAEFRYSYDIIGIPKDFNGDIPLGLKPPGRTFYRRLKTIFKNNKYLKKCIINPELINTNDNKESNGWKKESCR